MSHALKTIQEYQTILLNGVPITTDNNNKLNVNNAVVDGAASNLEVDTIDATGRVHSDELQVDSLIFFPHEVLTQSTPTQAVNASNQYGYVQTPSLTTAAGASYTFTISNGYVWTNSYITASIREYTGTQGIPYVIVKGLSGSNFTVQVFNLSATDAFNGSLKINFNFMGID